MYSVRRKKRAENRQHSQKVAQSPVLIKQHSFKIRNNPNHRRNSSLIRKQNAIPLEIENPGSTSPSNFVPQQKELMQNWMQSHISPHVNQHSQSFEYDNNKNTNPPMFGSMGGTMREIVTTPLEEDIAVNFEIEEYVEEEEDEDPMETIRARASTKNTPIPEYISHFPDTNRDHRLPSSSVSRPGMRRRRVKPQGIPITDTINDSESDMSDDDGYDSNGSHPLHTEQPSSVKSIPFEKSKNRRHNHSKSDLPSVANARYAPTLKRDDFMTAFGGELHHSLSQQYFGQIVSKAKHAHNHSVSSMTSSSQSSTHKYLNNHTNGQRKDGQLQELAKTKDELNLTLLNLEKKNVELENLKKQIQNLRTINDDKYETFNAAIANVPIVQSNNNYRIKKVQSERVSNSYKYGSKSYHSSPTKPNFHSNAKRNALRRMDSLNNLTKSLGLPETPTHTLNNTNTASAIVLQALHSNRMRSAVDEKGNDTVHMLGSVTPGVKGLAPLSVPLKRQSYSAQFQIHRQPKVPLYSSASNDDDGGGGGSSGGTSVNGHAINNIMIKKDTNNKIYYGFERLRNKQQVVTPNERKKRELFAKNYVHRKSFPSKNMKKKVQLWTPTPQSISPRESVCEIKLDDKQVSNDDYKHGDNNNYVSKPVPVWHNIVSKTSNNVANRMMDKRESIDYNRLSSILNQAVIKSNAPPVVVRAPIPKTPQSILSSVVAPPIPDVNNLRNGIQIKRGSIFDPIKFLSANSESSLSPRYLEINRPSAISNNTSWSTATQYSKQPSTENTDGSLSEIKRKYEHLLSENSLLRKDNMSLKQNLKQFRAPTPMEIQRNRGKDESKSIYVPPIGKPRNRRHRRRSGQILPKKVLTNVPTHAMKQLNWQPIDTDIIPDTRWKSINDSDIKIPDEFEVLFALKPKKKKNSRGSSYTPPKTNAKKSVSFSIAINDRYGYILTEKRSSQVLSALRKIRLQPIQIRESILNVNEKLINNQSMLYHLLEIAPNLAEQKYVLQKMNDSALNQVHSKEFLNSVEYFFYQLADISHLELRLQLWIFKMKFQQTMDERFQELYLLLEALKSIQRSSGLMKILQVILAFGNYMNAGKISVSPKPNSTDSNKNSSSDLKNKNSGTSKKNKKFSFKNKNTLNNSKVKIGVYGFSLNSLSKLSSIYSNAGKKQFSLLSYIYKYCRDNYSEALNCIEELKVCSQAVEITTHDWYQNVMTISDELSKFNRSLRKFRKAAISAPSTNIREGTSSKKSSLGGGDDDSKEKHVLLSHPTGSGKPYLYKARYDKFEERMKHFYRKANGVCKTLLDQWHECITIGDVLCQQYDFIVDNHEYEQLIKIFADFILDLKKARIKMENFEYKEKQQMKKSERLKSAQKLLFHHFRKRPSQTDLLMQKNIITNLDYYENKQKQMEDSKNKLSKLLYEHSVLMEASVDSDEPMSVQRVKYLKTLARSHELPNQGSTNVEAIQRQRKRRRSLSATEIHINPLHLAMTLAEDEEMN